MSPRIDLKKLAVLLRQGRTSGVARGVLDALERAGRIEKAAIYAKEMLDDESRTASFTDCLEAMELAHDRLKEALAS